jgi:hypothetical protein
MALNPVLNFRHRKAMAAFKVAPTLSWADLPPYVGRGTMSELMLMGLVEAADPTIGPYSKLYEWRRVNIPTAF